MTTTTTRFVVAVVPFGQTLSWEAQQARLKAAKAHYSRHTCGVWGPDADAELGIYFDDLETALVQAVEWEQKAIWIAHIDSESDTVHGYCLDLHTDKDSYKTKGAKLSDIPSTDYTEFRDIVVG